MLSSSTEDTTSYNSEEKFEFNANSVVVRGLKWFYVIATFYYYYINRTQATLVNTRYYT